MGSRTARKGNQTDENTGQNEVPKSIKRWVFIPIIGFTAAGTGALFYILYLLATNTIESELAWPALIIAFAGLPSAIITRVKSIMEAAKIAAS